MYQRLKFFIINNFFKKIILFNIFSQSAKSRDWRAGVLVCLHPCVRTCFVCLRDCLLSILAFFIFTWLIIIYLVAVLKYRKCLSYLFKCLRAWCSRLFYLLYIWKVKFQKLLYKKNLYLFRGIFREIFRTHLVIYDGFLLRNKLTAKVP